MLVNVKVTGGLSIFLAVFLKANTVSLRVHGRRFTTTTTTHPDALLQLGLAWSDHTQPGLFLQAAFAVIVGDPGGDAEAAGL